MDGIDSARMGRESMTTQRRADRTRRAGLAVVVLLALAGLGASHDALASGGAVLTTPKRVVPGSTVTVKISGFPAGSAARIQMLVANNPPSNCCASLLYPPVGKPRLVVSANGTLTIRWRVPTTYLQCTDVPCERHPPPNNVRRYQIGQRVEIFILTDSGSAFASAFAIVARKAKGCTGSTWHRLKCDAAKLKTVVACGFEIAAFGPLKAIKGIRIIKGFYDTRKVSKALQPVYKVYNDLMRLHLQNGTTGARIWKKLQKAKKIKDLVNDLIDVGKLVADTHDKNFEQFVKDAADLAGVGSCVDLVLGDASP
jgi:hypothetical protein